MKILECVLSDYQWYRRYKGGIWYNVTPYFAWYISVWTRNHRKFNKETMMAYEHLNCTEDYTLRSEIIQ